MLAGRDIVCVAGIAWDSYWLSLHQYMSRLARQNRVLFVNRPVALPWVLQRALRGQGAEPVSSGFRHVGQGLYIATPPPALPLRFERPVNALNQVLRRTFARRVVERLGFEQPILWIHEPDAGSMVGHVREEFSLYWVTDDHPTGPTFRANPMNRVAAMRARENELLAAVDLVITTAPELRELKCAFNPNTHSVPHGVDSDHFGRALLPGTAPAHAIAQLRPPVIGVVGQINKRIDISLVADLASARPKWSVAFVGPVSRSLDTGPLQTLPNVYFVGPAPLADLPSYLKAMSVCVIPFVLNEHTRTMHPLKSLEYLAAGKPVVATPLPALRAYGDLVALAKGTGGFISAIERMIAEDNEELRRERYAFASQFSWEKRLEEITQLIEQTRARKTGVAAPAAAWTHSFKNGVKSNPGRV